MDILQWLRERGIRTGLVSNCAPDVVEVWGRTELAPYFSYCAYSCREQAVKPEAQIYRRALEALQLEPNETVFVGDGSDEELTGAGRCGLHPVLVKVDLSNTYDSQREDVMTWRGPTIHALFELRELIIGE